jgi:hypothetical protein
MDINFPRNTVFPFSCSLFNDAVSVQIIPSRTMGWFDEWWIGQEMEGSDDGLEQFTFRAFAGRTHENYINLNQNSWFPEWR